MYKVSIGFFCIHRKYNLSFWARKQVLKPRLENFDPTLKTFATLVVIMLSINHMISYCGALTGRQK